MKTKRRQLALLTAVLCLSAPFVRADGGVTFANIAANDGAGIHYRRVFSPSRRFILDSLQALKLPNSVAIANYQARTPQKPHGAPGVAVFDYDGDGDLDIYVTNGPGKANSLYSNQLMETGKVTFVDVAEAAGVTATSQDSSGVCYGDLDNDGFEDLYVTSPAGEASILFHNNGDGTFTDTTDEADIAGNSRHHAGCAMGDFNGDGFLDLVIANTYDDWSRRDGLFIDALDPALEHNDLYMQDRAGGKIHFVDASESSGIRVLPGMEKGSWTWSVSAVDVDQDGDTDILWTDLQGAGPSKPTGDDRGYNRLFLNDGTGHFTDATLKAHLNKTGSWMGLAYGDFNCDGNIDFFSTNLGSWAGTNANLPRWFLGQKDGTFLDPGIAPMTALPFGWGDVAIDYDNDGDQDVIYYGDDELIQLTIMDNPGTILQNKGCSGKFDLDLHSLKTDHRFREVNGVAKGDFNNDGFEDIATVSMFRINPQPGSFFKFATALGPFNSPFDDIASFEVLMTLRINPGFYTYIPHTLLRGDLAVEMNSGNGNKWAAVRLIGSAGMLPKAKGNRDGIGAVVKFTPVGGKTVITPIIGGGSHASQSTMTASFGLGSAANGTVDVQWPGGVKNRLYEVANGERLNIPEIPCSYKNGGFKTVGDYNSCVRGALNTLVKKKAISPRESDRLFASAQRAYNEG